MTRVSGLITLALVACFSVLAPASAGAQVVRYHGYRVSVPAGWPVYRLGPDSTTCVRFNRHAVYLGQPGTDQICPPNSAGRTEAILIEPLLARAAAGSLGPALASVTNSGAAPAGGSSTEFVLAAHGLNVTATWDRHPGVLARALGLRRLPRAATSAPSAWAASAASAHAASATQTPGQIFSGLGFDTCEAPSSGDLAAWQDSPFRAVNVFIGGDNEACAQESVTPAWTRAETEAGWHLIPTYVGPQAPENICSCIPLQPAHATAEAKAAAADAVTQAQALGFGPGNPIYYDMESYTPGSANTPGVLTFLAAWDKAIKADHYIAGVYSSGASGINDIVSKLGSGYAEPQAIWIADWNYQESASDPYVPANQWADARIHQYRGGHYDDYGGITLSIDSNEVDAPTAAPSPAPKTKAPPDGTFVQISGTQNIYRIAGGAPMYVDDWSALGGPEAYLSMTQQQVDALSPVPANGTFLTSSTGGIYRVAGGAPLWVSSWDVFGGVQQSVVIDQWDLDNITNPAAHLRAIPASGTFLKTVTGTVYKVAGGAPLVIGDPSQYPGAKNAVTIDPWDIENISNPLAHLNQVPASGTVVEGLPSHSYYRFVAGELKPIANNSAAVTVPDSSLTAFPRVPLPACVVPALRRKTLAQAKRALSLAHCKLGKVRAPRRLPAHTLRVVRQSAAAKSSHPSLFVVGITLG